VVEIEGGATAQRYEFEIFELCINFAECGAASDGLWKDSTMKRH
jgi:hypothetical protein